MMSAVRRVQLCDLARESGYSSPATLAELTGLDIGTVSRHWKSPTWLDRIDMTTYQILLTYLPGLAPVALDTAMRTKRRDFTLVFERYDLALNMEVLDSAVRSGKTNRQFLSNALDAAAYVLAGDSHRAIGFLRSLWGKPQTQALDIVFGTDPEYRAFQDNGLLINAAARMTESLISMTRVDFPRAVAIAHLAHHTTKAGHDGLLSIFPPASKKATATSRNLSFAARGATMGVLRQSEDLDLVGRYAEQVQDDDLVSMIEEWAFPTWAGDVANGEDFELPRTPSLRRTAVELVREIRFYNEAYVWYLIRVYIPLAVERTDHTLGGKRSEISLALMERADRMTDRSVRYGCIALAQKLAADL
jgi:hypothetical protein